MIEETDSKNISLPGWTAAGSAAKSTTSLTLSSVLGLISSLVLKVECGRERRLVC